MHRGGVCTYTTQDTYTALLCPGPDEAMTDVFVDINAQQQVVHVTQWHLPHR